MKIIDNVLRGFKFEELGVGATFNSEGGYYIKTEPAITAKNFAFNCINLATGEFSYYEPDEVVHPFNCELIVL